jgi:pyrroloquinoline quinone (PQQ) biosynthesis protein C
MSQTFAAQLLATVKTPDITQNALIQGIANGCYTKDSLRAYIADLTVLAGSLPPTLASLYALCDEAQVRHALLENLLEEIGAASYQPQTGLLLAPERHHTALAARLARALGVVDAGVAKPQTGQWISGELRQGRWLGPFAYICVGIESNVPPAFRLLYEGLRAHYGVAETDLEFLAEHFIADEKHGAHGAELAAFAATTTAQQQEACNGAQRGALAFWHFHQRHARLLRAQRPVAHTA